MRRSFTAPIAAAVGIAAALAAASPAAATATCTPSPLRSGTCLSAPIAPHSTLKALRVAVAIQSGTINWALIDTLTGAAVRTGSAATSFTARLSDLQSPAYRLKMSCTTCSAIGQVSNAI